MKTICYYLSILCLFFATTSGFANISADNASTGKILDVKIKGMTCGECLHTLGKGLQELPGVDQVVINMKTNNAIIFMLPSMKANLDSIRSTLLKSGYLPTKISYIKKAPD